MLRDVGGWGSGDQVGMYSDWLLTEGESAERAGKLDQAADFYWKPVVFAERVLQQDGSDAANWWLQYTERASFQKLQPLLLKMGRKDEAAAMTYQLGSLQEQFQRGNGDYYWDVYQGGWTGLMMRLLAAIVVLLGMVILLGLAGLGLMRRTKSGLPSRAFGVCAAAADYAPLLLFLASLALFIVFRPVALTFNEYASSSWSNATFKGLEFSALAPYGMPMWYYGFSAEYLNAYHGWMVLIIGLSVVVGYILARGTVRVMRKRAEA